MRLFPIFSLLLATVGCASTVQGPAWSSVTEATLTDIEGAPYPLARHRGQVLLVVNVASKCGFTGQYAGLERLYTSRKDRGLVIIGIPSNDFGLFAGQEPGTEKDIQTFCTRTYGVTFPMMAKAEVKGEHRIPLYQWLTTRPGCGEVSWNFNKFLIARDGVTVRQFGSRTTPDDPQLLAAIDAALAAH